MFPSKVSLNRVLSEISNAAQVGHMATRDNYPSSGVINIDGGGVHVFALDGPARIILPSTGTAGDVIVILVRIGAEYAEIDGRNMVSGSNSSLITTAIYDGAGWVFREPVDVDFSRELAEVVSANPELNIDESDLKKMLVLSAIWVREIGRIGAMVSNNLDTSVFSSVDGVRTDFEKPEVFVGWLINLLSAIADVSARSTPLKFIEWMTRNLEPVGDGETYAIDRLPGDGYSALIHAESGTQVIYPGNRFELVGLGSDSPRLRITVMPYDNSKLASRDELFVTVHPHAGEVYELPISRVE